MENGDRRGGKPTQDLCRENHAVTSDQSSDRVFPYDGDACTKARLGCIDDGVGRILPPIYRLMVHTSIEVLH